MFVYLIFLSQQVLYFLLSTLVLTLYLDVVLSLSIWCVYDNNMFYSNYDGMEIYSGQGKTTHLKEMVIQIKSWM